MALNICKQSPPAEHFRFTTDQFAAQYLVDAQTIRKRLPNRRLLWPADSIGALIEERQQ